ncbi:hypothetical protein Hanom_Chr16g01453121 [Helianthus anomalus]
MSRKGRVLIYSVVTPEQLKLFVSTYRIHLGISPRLSGLTEPPTCLSERIVIYTLSFPFCGVWYPLSSFKMELLKHYGINFSQWKNRFIFFSPALLFEPLPARDPATIIKDEVPSLSDVEASLWKLVCENPTRTFNFSEGILALGGLSHLYSSRPKAFLDNNGE